MIKDCLCSACLWVALLSPAICQEDVRKPRDFSQANSVTILLSQPERGGRLRGEGLEHAFWEAGALTFRTNIQNVPCRLLSLTHEGYPKGYFYFAIDPTFKRQDISHVRIEVEYFDDQQGVFGVQYDAQRDGRANPVYMPLLPAVPLQGSQKWLTATFHIKDAAFLNSQISTADFRLWVSPPELCVKRVSVTRETPEQSPKPMPLNFPRAGAASLHAWNIQWDSGSKPAFASQLTNAPRWLEIRAPGSNGSSSWRTSVFLEPGEYRFVGKVKTTDLQGHTGLRVSYRPEAETVNRTADWTNLTYDFTVSAAEYVELVCELRADQGTARFDADSLKLIRK